MSFQTTQHRTVILDENNEDGALSFVQKFFDIGYEPSFPLKICALKYALNDLFDISNKHKILILYLHDETCDFSKRFCSYISNKEVGHILGEYFVLLGWDIGLEDYREDLIKAIREFDQLLPCISVIEQGRSVAIFINFCDENFQICSILRVFDGIDDFVLILHTLVDSFCSKSDTFDRNLRKEPEDPEYFTWLGFQQRMCDSLSNRDYDCFEPDELKYLEDKILYAFFGPPSDESGYNDKQRKQSTKMYEKILEVNNDYAEYKNQVVMAIVYNCLTSLEVQNSLEFSPVPVFILRKCREAENPCRIVIDHTGRVYDSWKNYLEDNKFCECLMIFPKDGRYSTDENGNVELMHMNSPACGVGTKILKATDLAGSVVGIGSTGLIAAAAIPALTIAPVVITGAALTGAAVGVYSVGRSIYTLIDRALHKESMNVTEAESRGAYIGIAAGTVGMAGAGANMLVAKAAASGIAVGTVGRIAVNSINIANIGIGGLAVGNSAVEIAMRWWIDDETPSTLSVLQLGASIFFFGHAVYNFRTAGTIIEESQTTVLDDYKSTLRSNRHRKTFNKLLRETMSENAGNLQKGRAEVISALRNIGNNKDEVFAFLTRNHGKINELGIKYSARDGAVTLNGIPIEVSEISSISRSDFASFYADLSTRAREPEVPSIRKFDIDMTGFMTVENFAQISKLVCNVIACETLQNKIMLILRALMDYIRAENGEAWKTFNILERVLPRNEFPRKLTELIFSYIQNLVEQKLKEYGMEHPDKNRKLYFMRSVCNELLLAFNSPTDSVLRFIAYSTHWIIHAYMEYQNKNERNDLLNRGERRIKKIVCSKCSGYHFDV